VKNDSDGNRWTAGCVSANEVEYFDIAEGKTTTLEVGLPLEFSSRTTSQNENIIVDLDLRGRGRERYFPYPRTNAQGIGGATVRVLDENGTELASGGIEYG
jgi:hypothetical protein